MWGNQWPAAEYNYGGQPAPGLNWYAPAPVPGSVPPMKTGFYGSQWQQTHTKGISSRCPELNPDLAWDVTMIRWDMRETPAASFGKQTLYTKGSALASSVGGAASQEVRLVCKDFPWSVEIKSNFPITCENIWSAIYSALREPIQDSEWGFMAMHDRKAIRRIEAAVRKRKADSYGSDGVARRIDFLGDMVFFKGLDKDAEFAKLREMPGVKQSTTYVIKLGS